MSKGLRNLWLLIKEAGIAWFDDRAQRLGASLAFYTVLAIPPLFVIVIFIAGLWMNADSARTEINAQISGLVGKAGAKAIQTLLTDPNPKATGLVASSIAIGTLLITAMGVFIELQDALNMVWRVEQKPGQGLRGFIVNRLLSFALIVGIGFLLLVSLVISAALAAMNKYFAGDATHHGIIWDGLNLILSLGVISLLFAVIFKVLPDVKITWRDVWVGSGITAGLFTLGKFLLGFYLGSNSVVSAYGAAGSVIIVLLWVYYSAQILFFGAELTQVYARRFGKEIEPSDHAQRITVVHAANPPKPRRSVAEKISPATE